ncbi:unnamed protein product [Cuscuta campestris]|uniref:RRM domain-containing protein n=1 Tax=Cuscuta campestris TaxID=132261 RepID=A0A484NLV1_9ASTE|nr:unnamed protein product [Cuscuta campestris]
MMPNAEQPFRLNWASFSTGDKRTPPEPSSDLSIFVGDLAADVTDTLLHEIFATRYSPVKSAKVVVDSNTGRSKGYRFVRFGDENERSRAMTEMNGEYCSSRPMRLGVATPKKPSNPSMQHQHSSQGGGFASNGAQTHGSQFDSDSSNTTIFVGGLDSEITDEEELRQSFTQFGDVVSVKIPTGKGCGFVQFAIRSAAEDALEKLNGSFIGKQTVRLSWGRTPLNKQCRWGCVEVEEDGQAEVLRDMDGLEWATRDSDSTKRPLFPMLNPTNNGKCTAADSFKHGGPNFALRNCCNFFPFFVAMQWKTEPRLSQEELWDRILRDEYMKYAVQECYYTLKLVLTSVLDTEGKKWVERVYDEIQRSIANRSILVDIELNKQPLRIQKVTALLGILACSLEKAIDACALKLIAFQRLDFTCDDVLDYLKKDNIVGKGGAGIIYNGLMPNGEQVAMNRFPAMSRGSSHDPDEIFGAISMSTQANKRKHYEQRVLLMRRLKLALGSNDNHFEEALKVRNLLEDFYCDHGVRPPAILDVREHVFTGSKHLETWNDLLKARNEGRLFQKLRWPRDADLRAQVRRHYSLLTIKDSAHNIPRNLEARRRLEFFPNSLFMEMPVAKPVREMLSFK